MLGELPLRRVCVFTAQRFSEVNMIDIGTCFGLVFVIGFACYLLGVWQTVLAKDYEITLLRRECGKMHIENTRLRDDGDWWKLN